jgi:hypothetical protein
MTVYTCQRCHYETNRRTDFLRHLQKQISCPPRYDDTSRTEILKTVEIKKPHVCEFCNKGFSYPQSLNRHCNTFHSSMTNSQNTTHTHAHNTTHTSSHNTTNTTHTNSHNTTQTINNPTFNINLNVFGQERIDYILEDREFLTKCLKDVLRDGIPDFFKALHLNSEVPENQNIKLKRQHHPKQVEVFMENADGETDWVTKMADPVLDDIIKKMVDILYIHKDNLYRELCNPTEDDKEIDDRRREKLINIKERKRQSYYTQIKDNIVMALKEKRLV